MKYVDYLHDLPRSDSPVISDKMESPIPLVHTRAEVPGQDLDLERNEDHQFLMNHSVKDFSWSGLTVTGMYSKVSMSKLTWLFSQC